MIQMSSGFAPAYENEGATGAAGGGAVTTEAPAASTTSTEAPASGSPSSSASGAGAAQPAPKMYAKQEVERMIQDRVKKYGGLGDPETIKQGLEKAKRWEQFEKFFAGDKTEQVSPEDAAFKKYMSEKFPGVDRVNDVGAQVQGLQKMIYDRQVNEGKNQIAALAKEKLGVDAPGAVATIERAVADSIAEDPDALKAWQNGDLKVLATHFEKIVKENIEPLRNASASSYSQSKANDKREVPPTMPAGGVSAPTSKTTVPTKEQRSAAAWKFMRDHKG